MKSPPYYSLLLAAVFSVFTLSANAASIQLTDPVTYQENPGNGQDSVISHVDNIFNYFSTDGSYTAGSGPDYGYHLEKARPRSVNGTQLQSAFNVAAGTNLYPELDGYSIDNFFKSGENPKSSENTGIFNTSLSKGYINTSSLKLQFEGFMMKVGDLNVVGLFDTPITELFFRKDDLKGISHVSLFNVSEVPIPAALALFAPALFGLLGFRRRLKAA